MEKEPLLPGVTYHIYNRGNNRENIFLEDKNYNFFLRLWKKYIAPISQTFGYSLQPNHFHFLLTINDDVPPKKISQAFSNCFNAYVKSFNKMYKRVGSLFQERFGRKVISNENYYTQIIYYIHANAEKHGIVKDFRSYPYSSYLAFLSDKPTLLCRNDVLDWFGGLEQFVFFHESNRLVDVTDKVILERLMLEDL